MIVISDTSPILNLAAVGKLDVLHDLYTEIVVPPAVQAELSKNGIDLDPIWTRVVAVHGSRDLERLLTKGLLAETLKR